MYSPNDGRSGWRAVANRGAAAVCITIAAREWVGMFYPVESIPIACANDARTLGAIHHAMTPYREPTLTAVRDRESFHDANTYRHRP